MTEEEFWTELEALPSKGWEVNKWSLAGNHPYIALVPPTNLSNYSGSFCPITAVCKVSKDADIQATFWPTAAKLLELDHAVATKIVAANDRAPYFGDPEYNKIWGIRSRILKTFGVIHE